MRVWIEEKTVKRRWWFGHKTIYFVCTEYMKWQQASRADAIEAASTMWIYLRDA